MTDYPVHDLAREPAPPYVGEGAFALWHFSEDDSLSEFVPRPSRDAGRPLVWAVDTRHAPLFWFPRECPRGTVWPVSTTTDRDRERFFGPTAAGRIHVLEAGWLARFLACRLYAYEFPVAPFRPHAVGGYWVSEESVRALRRVTVTDLLGRHADAGIEVRVTPSLGPFWQRVVASTLEFSGLRLGNAAPHPSWLALGDR